MTQWISADQVPALLAPGMRIYVGGGTNEATSLNDAIAAAPTCAANVEFLQFPLPGVNRTDFSALHPDARQSSFFLSPDTRKSFAAGRVDYLPMQMRRVFDFLGEGPKIDIAFLQLSHDGSVFRGGLNVDFLDAVLANSTIVIAEVNANLPVIDGATVIPDQRIDYAVRSQRDLPIYPLAEPDEAALTIGSYVADLINDGDCLQTGIGSIPYAVLQALHGKNDLGMHGGLIDDAGMALIRRGNINGAAKEIDRGKHIVGMAIGTQSLYDWLPTAPGLTLRSADYTHEVAVIAQLRNFVSINSAVEIDLTGQVNAEMTGGTQISGTGGSVDFMRAAAASTGGRSIVALTATARGGSISRIVPELAAGCAVTALRTDIDMVVTEYGVAELKGTSLRQRRERLAAVAAPQFRDQLL